MNFLKKALFPLVLFCAGMLVISTVVGAREATSPFSMPQSSLSGGFLTGPQEGDALTLTLRYLRQHRQELGLTADDLADVAVTDRYVTQHTGVTHLYLVQRLHGIEVFNGVINTTVTPDGRILFVGNRFIPNLSQRVQASTPTITAVAATHIAAEHLELTPTEPLTILDAANTPDQETHLSKGGISLNDIEAKLVYDASGKEPRLAWNIIIYQADSWHWWNVRVDALNGEFLSKNDWVVHDVWEPDQSDDLAMTSEGVWGETAVSLAPTPVPDDSSYRVYHLPIESPIHAPTPPPADGRTLENQPADVVGSPFGWHDTNGATGAEFTTTQGNNTHAYTDIDANNIPDPGSSPDGGSSLDFDFPIDLTQPPSAYRPAAVTHLFHWVNLMHDFNYRYGFDEPSGNFQANNYGNGGLGNDYVFAEDQDGTGTNGAGFATPPDGQNPRMFLLISTFPDPDVDLALDNGVVAHEHGHGISNRLTGGPSNVNCLGNAEQMGEGWGDWEALIMTMEVGDTGPDARGIGTYFLGQPPDGPGIRPSPYTTNLVVNDYTYADLPVAAIPHGVGFIWATMLWEMNWALIDRHGFDVDIYRPVGGPWTALSGNQLAHQLVTDGMKIQPCSPGFVDGRDAILAADILLSGGANQCIIWEAFAKRGLGFSASQGSSNSITDGTAAFDIPPTCIYLSITPASQTICQGQEAVYPVSVGTAFAPPVTMSAGGYPPPATANFDPNPVNSVPSTSDLTISNTNTAPAGGYTLVVTATDSVVTATETADLTIVDGVPDASTLLLPADGATGVFVRPTFEWTAVSGATDYLLEVATDVGFTNVVYTTSLTQTVHTATSSLGSETQYYWRVTASNACGNGTASAIFSFQTSATVIMCNTPALAIPDNPDVSDSMVLSATTAVQDLNITINANHTWVGDLLFTLTHQDSGTSVTVIDRPGYSGTGFGCSSNNIDVELDDEGVDGPVETQCAIDPALFGNPTPNNPLSAFDTEALNGTWVLTISDAVNGDTGLLNEWCLIASVTSVSDPAISLEKTVGTDPNSCAGGDNITVWGGTEVTYCYRVTNSGDVTFTLHTLDDDQLGNILTNFPYQLAPGATTFVTETAVLTQTTTNIATWTATDGAATAVASDSATVTVVSPVYGVELSEDEAVTGDVGTAVTYTLHLTNTGNITETFDLGVTSVWTATLSESPVTLNPGQSYAFTAMVLVPANAANGATDVATVTAVSQSDGSATDSTSLTTTAVAPPPPLGYTLYLPALLKP